MRILVADQIGRRSAQSRSGSFSLGGVSVTASEMSRALRVRLCPELNMDITFDHLSVDNLSRGADVVIIPEAGDAKEESVIRHMADGVPCLSLSEFLRGLGYSQQDPVWKESIRSRRKPPRKKRRTTTKKKKKKTTKKKKKKKTTKKKKKKTPTKKKKKKKKKKPTKQKASAAPLRIVGGGESSYRIMDELKRCCSENHQSSQDMHARVGDLTRQHEDMLNRLQSLALHGDANTQQAQHTHDMLTQLDAGLRDVRRVQDEVRQNPRLDDMVNRIEHIQQNMQTMEGKVSDLVENGPAGVDFRRWANMLADLVGDVRVLRQAADNAPPPPDHQAQIDELRQVMLDALQRDSQQQVQQLKVAVQETIHGIGIRDLANLGQQLSEQMRQAQQQSTHEMREEMRATVDNITRVINEDLWARTREALADLQSTQTASVRNLQERIEHAMVGIPEGLAALERMQTLNLRKLQTRIQQMTGDIPESLASLERMQTLNLRKLQMKIQQEHAHTRNDWSRKDLKDEKREDPVDVVLSERMQRTLGDIADSQHRVADLMREMATGNTQTQTDVRATINDLLALTRTQQQSYGRLVDIVQKGFEQAQSNAKSTRRISSARSRANDEHTKALRTLLSEAKHERDSMYQATEGLAKSVTDMRSEVAQRLQRTNQLVDRVRSLSISPDGVQQLHEAFAVQAADFLQRRSREAQEELKQQQEMLRGHQSEQGVMLRARMQEMTDRFQEVVTRAIHDFSSSSGGTSSRNNHSDVWQEAIVQIIRATSNEMKDNLVESVRRSIQQAVDNAQLIAGAGSAGSGLEHLQTILQDMQAQLPATIAQAVVADSKQQTNRILDDWQQRAEVLRSAMQASSDGTVQRVSDLVRQINDRIAPTLQSSVTNVRGSSEAWQQQMMGVIQTHLVEMQDMRREVTAVLRERGNINEAVVQSAQMMGDMVTELRESQQQRHDLMTHKGVENLQKDVGNLSDKMDAMQTLVSQLPKKQLIRTLRSDVNELRTAMSEATAEFAVDTNSNQVFRRNLQEQMTRVNAVAERLVKMNEDTQRSLQESFQWSAALRTTMNRFHEDQRTSQRIAELLQTILGEGKIDILHRTMESLGRLDHYLSGSGGNVAIGDLVQQLQRFQHQSQQQQHNDRSLDDIEQALREMDLDDIKEDDLQKGLRAVFGVENSSRRVLEQFHRHRSVIIPTVQEWLVERDVTNLEAYRDLWSRLKNDLLLRNITLRPDAVAVMQEIAQDLWQEL